MILINIVSQVRTIFLLRGIFIFVCGAVITAAVAEPVKPVRLLPNTIEARVAACTACHGAEGRAAPDGYYPRLAGKPQEYLFQQLVSFREGHRTYPPMQYLLAGLSDATLREFAAYFAGEHLPYPAPANNGASAALLDQGQRLVTKGDARRSLPACTACHGADLAGRAPAIPGLLGLPHDYISAQLGSWKIGRRRAREPDCMARIAEKLTPDDIGAIVYWLTSRAVVEPYVPAVAGTSKLPMECGSQSNTMGGAP